MNTSNLKSKDIIFIFSVGGGNIKKNISVNLIKAIKFAKKKKCNILSVIGKSNGYAAKNSDVAVVIPVKNQKLLTPFSEAYQALIWHLLVSHPELKEKETKWESVIEKNKAFFFDRDGIFNKSIVKIKNHTHHGILMN